MRAIPIAVLMLGAWIYTSCAAIRPQNPSLWSDEPLLIEMHSEKANPLHDAYVQEQLTCKTKQLTYPEDAARCSGEI